MSPVTQHRARYWRAFNVAVRVAAIGLTTVGVGLVMGFYSENFVVHVAGIGVGLLAATAGFSLLWAPTYRRDLGDSAWLLRSTETRHGRNWWTGDPKHEDDDLVA